ncbi:MAG: hypothetical protein R3264_12235 [Anaerolineae bacterium]|nr:hypothetical protein [Anaerolineae bacterium]
MNSPRRLITWGTGELGGRVAKLWRAQGGAVIGLTQTEKRHADLKAKGIEPQLGDPLFLIEPDDVLLLALPGYRNQGPAVEMLRDTPPPFRTVLIGSTGYYGLPTGTVDEQTPPGEGGRPAAMAAVERLFLDWAGKRGTVLRLGGLYRPSRGPVPALIRRGKPLPGPPNKTLALIHYDDAATATVMALQHPNPERVYLGVVTPCPTREEFYGLACRQLGLPDPTFDPPLPHPPAHFDTTLLQRDLLPNPAYPNWHSALAG